MNKLPPISIVLGLQTGQRAAILDRLFEPCIPLHTLSVGLMRDQKFAHYDDFIATIGLQLTALAESNSTSDTQWLHEILAAHPRLGEKKVNSAQSSAEQAHLKGEDGEVDSNLAELNRRYEKAFPGLRYV